MNVCIFQINSNNTIANEYKNFIEAEKKTNIPSKIIKSCVQGYLPIVNGYKFIYAPNNWICGIFPIHGWSTATIKLYECNFDILMRTIDYYSQLKPCFSIKITSPTAFLIQPIFVNTFFITGDINCKKLKWNGNRKLYKIDKISKRPGISQLLQIKCFFYKQAFCIQKAYRSWIWRKNYLWNPSTEIGHLHLIIRSRHYCKN